jgi:hypothetical protein
MLDVIKLEDFELMAASQVGCRRVVSSLKKNLQDKYGAGDANAWQIGIDGACSEMAVAKRFNVYWNASVDTFKLPDVGPLQVRSTRRSEGKLILHPEDSDDEVFILVTIYRDIYTLRGWILGKDGKQDGFWDDPAGGRPAFFVWQRYLNYMKDLKV